MLLNPIPYTTKQFTHNFESRMLVTEMSDLGYRAGQVPFKQLYDDAVDEGMALYNPRTGSVTYWMVVSEVKEEGDTTMWVLQPIPESCRRHPGVQNYTMHIYND
jgi:hypothetical protein